MRRPLFLSLGVLALSSQPVFGSPPLVERLRAPLPSNAPLMRDAVELDVDGDLDLDFAVVASAAPSVALWVNDGEGYYSQANGVFPTYARSFTAVAAGDLDGDLDVDLVIGGNSQESLIVLRNDGATFVEVHSQVIFPATADRIDVVELGDLDGDLDLDLLVGSRFLGLRFLRNLGAMNFGAAQVFAKVGFSTLPTNTIAIVDTDLDGDRDVIVGAGVNPTLNPSAVLCRNDGVIPFTVVPAFDAAFTSTTLSLAVGDVDQNGRVDVVLGEASATGITERLFVSTGLNTFAPVVLALHSDAPGAVHANRFADVDGDSDADLVSFYQHTSGAPFSLELRKNNSGTLSAPQQLAQTGNLSAAYPALIVRDVDRDSDVDILLATNAEPARLFLGNGNGAFSNVTNCPASTGYVLDLALGDIDGDQDADLVGGALSSGFTTVEATYSNDGRGVFVAGTTFSLTATSFVSTSEVALRDFDGDGDLDALVSSGVPAGTDLIGTIALGALSGPTRLILNDGSGSFSAAVGAWPYSAATTSGLATADFDADGRLDVVVTNFLQQSQIARNTSSGFVDASGSIPALSGRSSEAAIGDLDGDQILDIVIANTSQSDSLWLGSGGFAFSDRSNRFPASADDSAAVALGDLDLDGDLDVVLGNQTVASRILRNDGATFADISAQLPTGTNYVTEIGLADFDLDGDLDIALARGNYQNLTQSPASRILTNEGSAFVDPATSPSELPIASSVAIGDVDRDGDPDAVFQYSTSGVATYFGMARSLAWRAVPRIGKPLDLEIAGPANQSALLLFATDRASIPAPPYGLFQLDPAQLFLSIPLALDSVGRAVLSAPIPPSPVLVGLSAYAQAAVGTMPRLTNLEIVTFTDL